MQPQGWTKAQNIRYKNLRHLCSQNRADQLHGYHMQLISFCFSCICKKVFFMVRLICFSIHVHILFNCLFIIGNPSYFCLCIFSEYKMALQFKMGGASMINVPVICIHCSCPPPPPAQRGKGRKARLRRCAITFLLSTQCRGRAGF